MRRWLNAAGELLESQFADCQETAFEIGVDMDGHTLGRIDSASHLKNPTQCFFIRASLSRLTVRFFTIFVIDTTCHLIYSTEKQLLLP